MTSSSLSVPQKRLITGLVTGIDWNYLPHAEAVSLMVQQYRARGRQLHGVNRQEIIDWAVQKGARACVLNWTLTSDAA